MESHWLCPECRTDNPPTLEECKRCEFAVERVFQEAIANMTVVQKAKVLAIRQRRLAGELDPHSFQREAGITEKPRVLTPREKEVLALVSMGRENHEIAEELYLALDTVKQHMKTISKKLEAHSRAHACSIALRSGIID